LTSDGSIGNIFSLEFRGLGLPAPIYKKFTYLLNIYAMGEASCEEVDGGICILSKPCNHYS